MTDFETLFQQFALINDLREDKAQAEAVSHLNKIYQALIKPEKKGFSFFRKTKTPKGLYLWGGVGRGKTMLMDQFYKALPIAEKRRVHFNIFMMDIHNTIKMLREDGKGRDPLRHIAQDLASHIRVLCFDEFQVYDIADAMILAELFNHIFKTGITVITTSNVEPDNLYQNGLQRSRFLPFIPVLKAHMDVFYLGGDIDYRQQALRDDGVYFINNEPKMQKLFKTLTYGETVKETQLAIGSRTLGIEYASPSHAWISFNVLCGEARSAKDYKVLAEAYQTVFINHVPVMNGEDRNTLKRFITLIDTLYDAKVRVIMNAEDIPQNLYQGDDHAFEFERTISRLIEMQGEKYLA